MGISVCISTYNTLAYTQKCFQSLLATSGGLVDEIVVVDDCSSDGTREYLRTLGTPFKIICNDANCGYAYNNNLAVRHAKNEVVCLLNADTMVQPRWLQPMLTILENGESVGLVGNVQWNPSTMRYDHMGVFWTDDLIPKHFGKEWRFVPFAGAKQWPAVTAACCLVRKDVFLSVGGFDESYRNGYEDIDLCMRLGQKGYTHYVAYQSRIHHYVSSSPGRHEREQDNRTMFLAKWGTALTQYDCWRMNKLDGANYLVRYSDRPWKYNSGKFISAWRNVIEGDPTVSLPKLWPYG